LHFLVGDLKAIEVADRIEARPVIWLAQFMTSGQINWYITFSVLLKHLYRYDSVTRASVFKTGTN